MTTVSEVQFHPIRMLLCVGDVPHGAVVPVVRSDGATGDVRCEECGEAMHLVDVITVDRNPTWAMFAFRSYREPTTYTTAKLNPVALLSRMAR